MKRLVLAVCIALLSVCVALAQEPASGIDGDRREAMQLCDEHRQLEALPLLQKLVVALPADARVHEELGIALVNKAATVSDLRSRQAALTDARAYFLRAKELGDNSDLLMYFLSAIPPDGTPPQYSDNKEIQAAMDEGEAAFVKHEYQAAVKAYTRALLIDPNTYSAALYIGDCYFAQKTYGSAIEWFKRATEINPNTETAYRYWGDALLQLGKGDEAHEKFLLAIVAEPYQQRPWVGLKQWAAKGGLVLQQPLIKPKVSVTDGEKGGKADINITLDPSSFENYKNDPSSSAWLIYGVNRSLWRGDKFKEAFPNEKEYRHSLKEEVEALHLAASAVNESNKKKKKNLPADLAKLVELDSKGLLEPYVLISAADEGIAMDYEAYREKNRDKLLQYLREYITAEKSN